MKFPKPDVWTGVRRAHRRAIHTIAIVTLLASAGFGSSVHAASAKLTAVEDLAKPSGSAVWVKAFTAALEGSGIDVEVFDKGALGKEAEMHDLLQQNLTQMCMCATPTIARKVPIVQGSAIPFMFDSFAEFQKVAHMKDGYLDTVNSQAVPALGVRMLSVYPIGSGRGVFTSKQAVASPEELAGLRIRAYNKSSAQLLTQWGANGMITAWKEVPGALQTGVIDGIFQVPQAVLIFRLDEFLKHFYQLDEGFLNRTLIVNEQWYAGLSAEAREAINTAIGKAEAAATAWADEQARKDIDALKQRGVQIIQVNTEDREKLAKIAQDNFDKLAPADIVAQYLVWRDKVRSAK